MATNLSQYEGYLIKEVNDPALYVILHGKRRHILNPTTFKNLYGNYWGPQEVVSLQIVPDGGPLSDGAILARPNNGPAVYLVTDGVKMHVTSPFVLINRFHFEGDIRVVDHVLLDFIPTGPAI